MSPDLSSHPFRWSFQVSWKWGLAGGQAYLHFPPTVMGIGYLGFLNPLGRSSKPSPNSLSPLQGSLLNIFIGGPCVYSSLDRTGNQYSCLGKALLGTRSSLEETEVGWPCGLGWVTSLPRRWMGFGAPWTRALAVLSYATRVICTFWASDFSAVKEGKIPIS
jgi:hypothetical protein